MITKRSKDYVPHFYTQIGYKNTTVNIKNRKEGGANIIVSKGTLHFKYVPKE